MGPRKKMITALAFAVVTITLPMRAQHNEPFNISLAGGIGFPLGDFDDGFKLGWHGLAAASYMLPNASVGFQVEGAFSRFHDDQPASNPKNNLLYGAGNMVYQIELPGTRTVLPYLPSRWSGADPP
jgi:hypothetical protein